MNRLNDYKAVKYIKCGLCYILRPFVIFEHNLYSKIRKIFKPKRTRRLFATTGNISLINALAIINEIGDFEKYDDILIIDTGKGGVSFLSKQLEIASLHKFKQIVKETHLSPGVQIVLYNIFAVDEIYFVNHPGHINTITPIFKDIPITLIDEGPGSLMDYKSDKIQNLQSYKTHKYVDKIDFFGLDNLDKLNFENLDIDEFRKISNILSQKYPIDVRLFENEKTILYCAIYWEVSGLDRETFIKEQKLLLENLINAGYSILYKAHPRDNDFYGLENHPQVHFIESKLPIELYNLDILALVSMSSSCSISYSHYWNIPCFSDVLNEMILEESPNILNLNVVRCIIKEYAPNYKKLLDFDVKNTPREVLKQQIKDLYADFIKDKPLLSDNKNVKEFAAKYAK